MIKKVLVDNKQVTFLDNDVYLDVDLIVDNKEIWKKLNFIYDKIAYLDFNYSTEDFTITKLIFCKTRLHVYLCNVYLKLNKQLSPEEIYAKVNEVLDKVIT